MRFLLFLFFIILNGEVYAQETYVNDKNHYTLQWSSKWKKVTSRLPVDLILQCNSEDCDSESRLIVNSNFTSKLKQGTNKEFFRQVPKRKFPDLVKTMVRSFGKVEHYSSIKKDNIGNMLGYIGKFDIGYFDGRKRKLLYGLTFSKGIYYHLQFFTKPFEFDNDVMQIEKVFNSFKVATSGK